MPSPATRTHDGATFGAITVTRQIDGKHVEVTCGECGGVRTVLRSNAPRMKSCGCSANVSKTTHGMSKTYITRAWASRDRCERWQDAAAFVADMGPGADSQRLVYSGPVLQCGACDECKIVGATRSVRWGDAEEAARSKADHIAAHAEQVTAVVDGVTLTDSIPGWARRMGLTKQGIHDRIDRGWPRHLAVTMPKGSRLPKIDRATVETS